MTPHEFLVRARALIEDPSHWVKYNFATTADGDPCREADNRAVCFCASGALTRIGVVSGFEYSHVHDAAWSILLSAISGSHHYYSTIAGFNDAPDVDHATVLAVFDAAIEATRP
jgi:hypothetical protein